MSKKFVHVHLHTEYSLLDGMSKITDLLTHVKENNMDTLALTDHGVMYGAIEFYKKCQKAEVKPIIGMEAYTTNIPLTERPEKGRGNNFHLLLLAKNYVGYQNLMKLTSIGHLDGYYYRPRITREILAKHSEGLICTSACPAGELARALVNDTYDEAKKTAQWFADVFGDDYYLEIQRHNYATHLERATNSEIKKELTYMRDTEKIINEGVVKLSRDMGIPLVATNDAHYIKEEDATAQDALVCVSTGTDVNEIKRLRFIDTPEYYVKSPEAMYDLFPDFPDACENTVKIAEKCDIEITLGKWFFPKMDLPKGVTPDEQLKKEAVKGLRERYKEITPELKKRLSYEIKVIIDKGYPEYFLIYKDMSDWARENGIPINTRGSAAGSLTSYSLGITTVDPIRYLLPFERFLNPFRPSAPDIDLDISDDRREDMIAYLTKKYGEDKVAQICTFGRMLAKGSVRDVARVLGYSYAKGDQLAKTIPLGSQGFPMTIKRAFEESEEFKTLYEADPDSKRIVDLAMQIEGNARHISVHAAGIVISPTAMTDFTPVQRESSGGRKITQYEMHACEDVGLVKLDILGIRNLTILEKSIRLVEQTEGTSVDIHTIPIDDAKTFKLLSEGNTFGVFQLSGSGITRCLVGLKPKRIEDIFIAIALFRPGPMANIDEYIARKEGKKPVEYYHPKMEKFLDKSLGVLVYQDDLLYTALEVAGYNWEEVDKFRKAVGKKIPEEMAKQHITFVDGCQKFSGMTKDEAEGLWKLFEPFQGYGFNKAHTASYGMVSYQTAYMKANYPVQYMCALLTAESGDAEKIATAIGECKVMNITVLPPDINESSIGFTVVDDKESVHKRSIRFGLSAIKNVGEAAIEAIIEGRKDLRYTSFLDFIMRVDNRKVNKRVVESLIKVGAMGAFGTRASLLEVVDEVRNKAAKPKGFENQQGLFGTQEIKTSVRDSIPELNLSDKEFTQDEMSDLEIELLGFSLSSRPISELLGDLRYSATHKIDEINSETTTLKNKKVRIAALIEEVRVIVTKKSNQEMAFVKCKDETGSVDIVVFPSTYSESRAMLTQRKAVLIEGKVDEKDDKNSIIVETINTEETFRETNDIFYIRIPSTVSPEELQILKTILTSNHGTNSVCLYFEKTGKKVVLPMKVNWSKELSQRIAVLLGNKIS